MSKFLKIKADRFLETAKEIHSKEYYDLCSFSIEQAVQLYLKFSILQYLVDFERTHSIEDLLQQYKKLSCKNKKIEEPINEFKETIDDLEIARIESRYIPAEFTKNC